MSRAQGIDDENCQVMLEYGVTWAERTIPMHAIDQKASKELQARPVYLDSEVVSDYAASLRAGDRLPRPIVRLLAGDRWQILSGNHTVAAARANSAKTVDVFAIERVSSETANLLVPRMNVKNGANVSIEHRYLQAVHLQAMGHSQDRIAKALNVSLGTIQNALRAAQATERAERQNVKGFDFVPMTIRALVAGVLTDQVFSHLATAAVLVYEDKTRLKVGSKQKQFSELITLVKKAEDETAALDLIDRYLDSFEVTKHRGTTRMNAKDNFVSACGKLMKVNVRELVRLTDDPHEAKLVVEWADDVRERLADIAEAVRARRPGV